MSLKLIDSSNDEIDELDFINSYTYINKDVYFSYKKINVKGQTFRVSSGTYNILKYLYENKNKIIPKETLLQYGWPERKAVSNNVNVSICQLRTILEGADIHIENIRNIGFKILINKQ